MPRLRVDKDTTETEIVDAIKNLFAASHVIDDALTAGQLGRAHREIQEAARDDIHEEIERLTNIVRVRRLRITV